MDDFNISSLHESKNEWGARLLTILTPLIIEGFRSIFDESYKLCRDNDETEKYLMTFQNFIARIPKWNPDIIEKEKKRIIERSGCGYLEDLIICIHIIQLKLLSAMRVGKKQKKIDINIPKMDDFIHKCYINVARNMYKNVYLFEVNCTPLEIQKHGRELEIIVQECILNTVRDGIPVENILRAYMDETVEEDVVEEIKEQVIDTPVPKETESIFEGKRPVFTTSKQDIDKSNNLINNEPLSGLKFNDVDSMISNTGKEELVNAPKTIERLEEISEARNQQRKIEENDDDEEEKLTIMDTDASLDLFDIQSFDPEPQKQNKLDQEFILDDIEVLA